MGVSNLGWDRERIVLLLIVIVIGLVLFTSNSGTYVLAILISAIIITLSSRYIGIRGRYPLIPYLILTTIAMVNFTFGFLPSFADAAYFDSLALETMREWRSGNISITRFYSTTVALLYFLVGYKPPIAVIFNIGVYSIACSYWIRIGEIVTDIQYKSLPALLFAISPAGVMYHTSILREAITLLIVSSLSYNFILFLQKRQPKRLVTILLLLLPLAFLRSELVPAFILSSVGVIVFLFTISSPQPSKILVITISTAIVFAFSIYYMVTNNTTVLEASLVNRFKYLNPFDISLIEAKRTSEVQRAPTPAYLPNNEFTSWLVLVRSIPLRIIYLVYTPFPWKLSNYQFVMAAVDSIYWISLSSICIICVRCVKKYKLLPLLFLISFGALVLIGYSITSSTVGAAPRRRLYAVPILITISSKAIESLLTRVDLEY